jgi:hypothetical protein
MARPRGRGIVCYFGLESYIARAAEVSIEKDNLVRVNRVVMAVDCGTAVNLDGVKAMAEGAVNFAPTASPQVRDHRQRWSRRQGNFDDYPGASHRSPSPMEHRCEPRQRATGRAAAFVIALLQVSTRGAKGRVCSITCGRVPMHQRLEKRIPIRLAAQDYEKLRQCVLRRDGWRCQFCGSRQNLEVHHQQFRSHSGEDVERNLITFCNDCHSSYHGA